jgi:2-methylcitrate dehydratase PrpD
VDAALELRRKLGTPWDPKRPVRVGMAKVVDVQCGFDYAPSSALNAQMSLRYVVAAALSEGQALPPQFSDAKIADPALTAFAGRIQCEHDPALDKLYPARFAAWVAVEDKGQWMRVDVLDPLGSTANPVDANGVVEKFRGINPQLPVDAIANTAYHIEQHSVRALLNQLVETKTRKLQKA